MSDKFFNIVERKHFRFCVEFLLEFLIVDFCVSGGDDQNCPVVKRKRKRFCNMCGFAAHRFGGKGAKAVIVTTEPCHAAARHRAAQLGIAVIDLEELRTGQLVHRLKVVMKAE